MNLYDDKLNDKMTIEKAIEVVENMEHGTGVDYDPDLPWEFAALLAVLDGHE